MTPNLKVPYWVNPKDISGFNDKERANLHDVAENKYLHIVSNRCDNERIERNRKEQDAQGWFGPDEKKMDAVRNLPMTNCKRLRDLGINVRF